MGLRSLFWSPRVRRVEGMTAACGRPCSLLLLLSACGFLALDIQAFLHTAPAHKSVPNLAQAFKRSVVPPAYVSREDGGAPQRGGSTNRKESPGSDDETQQEKAMRVAMERSRRQAGQAAKLIEKGVTDKQLEAYTGIRLVELDPDTRPTLRVTPSNEFVDRDKDGELKQARFVYVDEYTCIGCTNCASVAPNTFFMDDEHGRARVYKQWGDKSKLVQTAIETCPVDCIHYVAYDELQKLEKEREGIKINYKARLVGSEGLLSGSGSDIGIQEISGNQEMRCLNCPSKGCYNCPMFGVGENPAYVKKRAAIADKRAKRQQEKEKTETRKRLEL